MGDLSLPWKPSHQEIYVLGAGFSGKRTSDVLRYPPVQSMSQNGRTHPHEKPVALIRELLGKCPAGTILDPFMGSGTTLVAAQSLGRKSIGVELEEKYCEIAVQRLQQQPLPLWDTPSRDRIEAQQGDMFNGSQNVGRNESQDFGSKQGASSHTRSAEETQ
jgi:hypothetical protein